MDIDLDDPRPHAFLDTGGVIFATELKSIPFYTFLPVQTHTSFYGFDMPPTVITSIWHSDHCAYCTKPIDGYAAITKIVPPSWGGAKNVSNCARACDECCRKKSALTRQETFDGRTGYYWDGLPWVGIKNIKPKRARENEPALFNCKRRDEVEQVLPHRLIEMGPYMGPEQDQFKFLR